VIAFVALALVGTVLPFWLFAHGQKGTSPAFAGAMVNIEPLVGAVIGWVAFGDPVGIWQIGGAVAVVVGILLSTVPWDRITLAGLPQRLPTRFELP
jgi:drug/metabolite transporter (DMT)-like permease